jgi:hypothetical protein
MSPILGIYASQISGHLVTNNYSSIQTVTVGSGGASSISFTSIPSTYTHLQIRGITRATASDTASQSQMRINGDSGNSYTLHDLYGTGSTTGAENGFGSGYNYMFGFDRTTAANSTANTFGTFIMDIVDYSNTNKYKTVRCLSGYDSNGSGQSKFWSSLWLSTSAVTSLVMSPQDGSNYAQYSSFALYGVK